MKRNETVDFAENFINSLVLVTKLEGNQNFLILKILKNYSMKKNGTVDYAENSIESVILVTKLKRNQNLSILKILKKLIQ